MPITPIPPKKRQNLHKSLWLPILKEVQSEYPGRTIENIIQNLESIIKEFGRLMVLLLLVATTASCRTTKTAQTKEELNVTGSMNAASHFQFQSFDSLMQAVHIDADSIVCHFTWTVPQDSAPQQVPAPNGQFKRGMTHTGPMPQSATVRIYNIRTTSNTISTNGHTAIKSDSATIQKQIKLNKQRQRKSTKPKSRLPIIAWAAIIIIGAILLYGKVIHKHE